MSDIVPIINLGLVKSIGWQDLDGMSDIILDLCILAATAEIEKETAPRKIASRVIIAESYDGSAATGRYGERLYLDTYPVTAIASVVENGVTLAVGSGYDAAGAYGVLRYDAEGVLIRKAGTVARAWEAGLQNIAVTCTAGFVDPSIEASDLAIVCARLAILCYRSSRRIGESSLSREGTTLNLIDELSAADRATIRRYAPWGRPRGRLAA